MCGGETKLCGVYTTIEDEKLSYNDPVIVKYRCCDECGHVFASNDIADKKYWKKEDIIESKNNKINYDDANINEEKKVSKALIIRESGANKTDYTHIVMPMTI